MPLRQQLVEREKPLPVIFALSRKQLSRALKRAAKTSVVAVLNYDGAGERFAKLTAEASLAREGWWKRWRRQGSPAPEERFLVHAHIGSRPVLLDPLLWQVPAHVNIDEEDIEETHWFEQFTSEVGGE